jgi:hypothetical protein
MEVACLARGKILDMEYGIWGHFDEHEGSLKATDCRLRERYLVFSLEENLFIGGNAEVQGGSGVFELTYVKK